MNKSEKITIISTIILVGFFIGIVVYYVFGMYLGFKFPFNTFLFDPKMHFGDFYETMPKYPLAPYVGCYFPLAYIILAPFSIFKSKLAVYALFVILFLCFLLFENIKFLSCKNLKSYQNFQNIFIITFLAYPVLFLLDRGNFDMVLFPILFFAVYFLKMRGICKVHCFLP